MSSTDLLTIRSRIATALSGQIGTYTYQSGATTPALRVEDGTAVDYEEQPKVTGLEVIIQPYTDPSLRIFIGDGAALEDVYAIRLAQRDVTKTVQSVIPALFLGLRDILSGNPVYLPRNTRLDSLEQAIFFVPYKRS